MQRTAGTAVGVLGLAQGFAGLAFNFLPAEPNAILANGLFVGFVVCVVVGLLLFFWPQRAEQPTTTATQSGNRSVQIQGETINFQGTISIGEEEVPAARLPGGRTLVDVTPDYLTGLFTEHTSIQAERLVEAFIGKWIRLSGSVRDVAPIGEDDVIIFLEEKEFGYDKVLLFFNGKTVIENQLRVLRKGERITTVGQIQRVHSASLELKNCELEKP